MPAETQTNGTAESKSSRAEVLPLLITTAEVATMLGVSARTVKRLIAAKQIPGVIKIGKLTRIRRALLETWVGQNCPPRRWPAGQSHPVTPVRQRAT
jgi:excisionase family DNA binding protein